MILPLQQICRGSAADLQQIWNKFCNVTEFCNCKVKILYIRPNYVKEITVWIETVSIETNILMLGPIPCRSTYKLINNTIFYPGMNTAFLYNAVFIPGLFFIFSFHPDRRIPRGRTISLILSWYTFRNPNLLPSPFPIPWNKSH